MRKFLSNHTSSEIPPQNAEASIRLSLTIQRDRPIAENDNNESGKTIKMDEDNLENTCEEECQDESLKVLTESDGSEMKDQTTFRKISFGLTETGFFLYKKYYCILILLRRNV